jgi:ribosomal protein S18 acetylase RimI-like enzyme
MIKKLDWDSSFFVKEIGKTTIDINFDLKEFYLKAVHFDLVYLFSDSPIAINAKLMDIKYSYSKSVKPYFVKDSSVSLFNSNEDDYNQLLALTYLSGHESRFVKDSFFDASDFKRLYKHWIDKNLSEVNNQVLVYKIKKKIVGFVSFSKNEDQAAIELIAVDEIYQGQGLGKLLIQEVENKLSPNSILSVPTQESNIGACKFYTKYGFNLKNKIYIYHYANDSFQ